MAEVRIHEILNYWDLLLRSQKSEVRWEKSDFIIQTLRQSEVRSKKSEVRLVQQSELRSQKSEARIWKPEVSCQMS